MMLMSISIRQYRKNHWQLSGRYEGTRFFIQKGRDGKPITSYEQAFLWKTKAESEIANGTFNPHEWSGRNPWRFDVAIEKWVANSISDSEYKANKLWTVKKFLIAYFKQKDFRRITDSDVTAFYRYIKNLTYKTPPKQQKPYTDKRIKDILSELKGFLLSQKHHFQKFPDFPKIRVQQPAIAWINEKQQNEIFEFLPNEDKPIFTFLRYTGCRPNEAGGLLKENVDLDKGSFVLATAMTVGGKVRATTKTKIARALPIIDEIRDCFNHKDESKFVFTALQSRPYSTKMLTTRWKEANQKAHKTYGTLKINLYNGLKHSFGMQRLARRFSLDEIKEVFGHTTTATTRRYAQFLTSNLANVMSGRLPKISPSFTDLSTQNQKENRLGAKDSNLGWWSQSP